MHPALFVAVGPDLYPVGPLAQQLYACAPIDHLRHRKAASRPAAKVQVRVLHDDGLGVRSARTHRGEHCHQAENREQESEHRFN